MRFVFDLYLTYPKIIALKSIFDSSDDETKSDKEELESTEKISDQTFNCHVNIVLSVYTEWLSKELKWIKITLLATSSAPE